MSITIRHATTYVLTTDADVQNQSALRDVVAYAALPTYNQSSLRDLVVYAAVAPPGTAAVRSATAYVLSDDIRGLGIRQATNYILGCVNGKPAFNTDGPTALLNAINREYGKQFLSTHLSFGNPSARSASDIEFNTTVTATASATSGFAGTFDFRYSRFSLATGFAGKTLSMPAGMGNSIHNSLAVINAQFGLALAQRDLVDAPITNGATGVLLTVASTSYLYTPGTTVQLGS